MNQLKRVDFNTRPEPSYHSAERYREDEPRHDTRPEPSHHSVENYRKHKSRDDRSWHPDDLSEESEYEEQRSRRRRERRSAKGRSPPRACREHTRPRPSRSLSYKEVRPQFGSSRMHATYSSDDHSTYERYVRHEPRLQDPSLYTRYESFSGISRHTPRSDSTQYPRYRDYDEDDYVPLRMLESSGKHHRLLKAPSDNGSRR